jgi:YgiT-type zinc finger domain-containing protein
VTEIKQCETCHIGTMHPMKAAYSTWLQDQFVLVPNIDAWVCDVCGDFLHDPDKIATIELLVGNKSGASHKDRNPQPNGDSSDHSILSTDRSRSA